MIHSQNSLSAQTALSAGQARPAQRSNENANLSCGIDAAVFMQLHVDTQAKDPLDPEAHHHVELGPGEA